jgi:thiosulfate dehydrogenase (quinone) large subunit
MHKPHRRLLVALLRMSMGWVFLWAFFDKLIGLGFSTCRVDGVVDVLCKKAWLMGGSPTFGFLSNASGPFAPLFHAIAGHPIVNTLFMLGLLGVGVALITGAGMRLGTWGGALMLVLMYVASPPTTNPFLDDHIVYALVLVLLRWMHAGDYYGLGQWWHHHSFVHKYPWLR